MRMNARYFQHQHTKELMIKTNEMLCCDKVLTTHPESIWLMLIADIEYRLNMLRHFVTTKNDYQYIDIMFKKR